MHQGLNHYINTYVYYICVTIRSFTTQITNSGKNKSFSHFAKPCFQAAVTHISRIDCIMAQMVELLRRGTLLGKPHHGAINKHNGSFSYHLLSYQLKKWLVLWMQANFTKLAVYKIYWIQVLLKQTLFKQEENVMWNICFRDKLERNS